MQNNIEVHDNFLPETEFKELQKIMLTNEFPWFYDDYVVDTDDSDNSVSQFVHPIFMYGGWCNMGYKHLIPILDQINPSKLIRIKANLNLMRDNPTPYQFHVDYTTKGFMTAIFYINTNDGATLFRDGTEIKSVANRLIIFPGHIEHTGRTCTDKKRRVLINFCYFT